MGIAAHGDYLTAETFVKPQYFRVGERSAAVSYSRTVYLYSASVVNQKTQKMLNFVAVKLKGKLFVVALLPHITASVADMRHYIEEIQLCHFQKLIGIIIEYLPAVFGRLKLHAPKVTVILQNMQ